MTTTPPLASHRIVELSPDVAPGLDEAGRRLQSGTWSVDAAAPALRRLDDVFRAAGPAWRDATFLDALRREHEAMGAAPPSLRSLEALAGGSAGCVITGQQPGVWGGPLYCAYKIAGAVALAQEIGERSGTTVVPVYWCGGDDSDFEEVRRIWFWSSAHAPFRGELPGHLWRPGMRVGSMRGDDLQSVEAGMLDHAGSPEGTAWLRTARQAAREDLDFGQRAGSFFLQLFRSSGLVVVDARAPRLRALGRDLFADYARRHADLTTRLRRRSAQLAATGRPVPLHDGALESGLFRLEEDVRIKLAPSHLARAAADDAVTPSVILRPLWQDQLLQPIAAVLGPAELAYHAQIAPLYEALGVEAAHPVARPHLTLWPPGLPWPREATSQKGILEGGTRARSVLAALAAPPAWSKTFDRTRAAVRAAMGDLARDLEAPEVRSRVDGSRERMLEEIRRLESELDEPVLARRSGEDAVWAWADRWLAVRGVPQERALAAATGPWAWGEAFGATLDALGRAYVRAVEAGDPTTFLAREEP